MTLRVRDEEDILEENLRYHLSRGVDFLIAIDNGSQDRTREILDRYERAGLARVLDEPPGSFLDHGQEWLTRMARLAATDHGADWVVHDDADEFWWPLVGSLKDALGGIGERYGCVHAPRVEFVGRPDAPRPFAERLTVRERIGKKRPKVAHRADPDVLVLDRGAHDVTASASDDPRDVLRPLPRAAIRAAHAGRTVGRVPLVPAPRWPVRIFHFPLRSLAQYRRRVELLLESDGDRRELRRLRRLTARRGAGRLYEELITDDRQLEAGLGTGELVADTRLRDFLRTCPDPVADGPTLVSAPEPSSTQLREERDEVEEEAMATLAHHARASDLRLRRLLGRRRR